MKLAVSVFSCLAIIFLLSGAINFSVFSSTTENNTVLEQAQKSVEANQKRPTTVSTPSGNQTKVTIPQGVPSEETKHFVPHFVPETLTVMRGTEVQWVNDDAELHTVTSGSPEGGAASGSEFDSSYLSKGDVFNYTFSKNGAFKYYCTLHPYMTASIVVTEDGKPPITNDTVPAAPETKYVNDDYGVSIKYPSDWRISEVNLAQYVIAQFLAPELGDVMSAEYVSDPAYVVLVSEKLPVSNMTLSEFITSFLKDVFPNATDYKILQSNRSNLAGMESEKIIMYEYPPGFFGGGNYKVMRNFAIDHENGIAYMFKYNAHPGTFSKYLPTAEQMMKSFQLSK